MFASSVQPSLVSLFSSASSDCLSLFEARTDAALREDSVICVLNDASSEPQPAEPAQLISPPAIVPEEDIDRGGTTEGRALGQTVLHIQSPTLRTTYIRCPAPANSGAQQLGLKHPWIHLQVRNLGREWSLEVGIVDRAGREGIIRCSTFQREPALKMTRPPLLHLPLSFPGASSRPLTAWSTINLNLPSILPRFSSVPLIQTQGDDPTDPNHSAPTITVPVPSGTYSHISYVKVYANCRLKRIWLSEGGPGQALPLEFDLYGQ